MRLLLSTLLLASAGSARAGLTEFSNLANFDLGIVIPTISQESGYGSVPLGKASPAVGASFLRQTSTPLAWGGRISYSNFGKVEKSGGSTSAPVKLVGSSTQLLLQGLGRWQFREEESWSPYLIAGLGISQFQTDIRGMPGSGFRWSDTGSNEDRTLIRENYTGFAISFGIGADFPMGENLQGAADLTWNDAQVEAVGDRKGYTIGLGFHIGWKLD